jgi:NAD(P)-dependent dehydrogenase (short-subunit alcohol dehydrogenase family)
MGKLDGKVAVITGGNSGIGLATAQRFVNEGAYVFITGRRQSELDAAVKQIGKNVTAVQSDVSSLADLDRLYATVKKEKGHLDIVFANAGTGEFAPLGSITEQHYDKTFDTNVKGLLFTVQKAASTFERRQCHRSECFDCLHQGSARIQCLQRNESRCPLFRARLVRGSKRPQDSR